MNISKMYSNTGTPAPIEKISNKAASRVLGGMKAAGVLSTVVDIDGSDLHIPRIEYVEALEKQIRELREKVKEAEVRIIKLSNSINSIKNEQRMRMGN